MNLLPIILFAGLLLAVMHFSARRHVRRARMLQRLSSFIAEGAIQEKEHPEWQSWLKVIATPIAGSKENRKIGEQLQWAGFRKPWQVHLFMVAKLVLVLAAVVAGFFWFELEIATLLKKPFGTLKYLFLLFLAARAPDWWLADQVKKRRAKIRETVPQAIDLLTICVESGVSLEEAFGRVSAEIQNRAPEIAQEFRLTRSEMLVMDRTESLKRMKTRGGVRELERLAGTLLQSLQYGTPIVDALANIAAESRAEQVTALEEKAGSIAARIGIPLIVLILFPLVALIAAPAAINLMRTFQSVN